MTRRAAIAGSLLALVALGALVPAVAVVATRSPGSGTTAHDHAHVPATPARHIGPQGRVGQFVATCGYSHSAADDPIVHPRAPGRSHRHDFFGATEVDASSTAESLLSSSTTCDKAADTASYWQPTLYDHGEPVTPTRLQAYYRAAPEVDRTQVEPFPLGLELVAGDPVAQRPNPAGAAGWTCGASTRLHVEPPVCPASAPLHLVLTFPDCWDGDRLRSDDHVAHAAYSTSGRCPDTHPVHLPQLTVSVAYPVHGPGHALTLASGSVHSAHGDFLNAWQPDGLAREVEACIARDVVCDLASNRAEEGPFFHE